MHRRGNSFPRYLYILLGVCVFLFGLSWLVSSQLQEMQAPLREERRKETPDKQSASARETVVYHWDPEDMVAQQIENELRLKQPDNLLSVLTNIEQNIQYNRNKAASYFYLARAYESLNDKEKTTEIYNLLANNFNNRSIALCAFDVPRTSSGTRPHYTVYIQEEAYLRLYFLTGQRLYLETLLDSARSFGDDEHGHYTYARLARYNLLNPQARVGSAQYCYAEYDGPYGNKPDEVSAE